MKTLMMAAIALLTLSGAALADGGMSNAFGNVVRVTGGDSSFDATFTADGSYTDTRGVAGTWTLGEQLCIHVQTEDGAQDSCGSWNPDLTVGGSWSTDGWSDDGSVITVEIIAGP